MKSYIKIILLLLIPMLLAMGYALSPLEIGSGDYMLEKADLSGVKRILPMFFANDEGSVPVRTDDVRTIDSLAWVKSDSLSCRVADSLAMCVADSLQPKMKADSLCQQPERDSMAEANKPINVHKPDLSKLRIMIFGDSMLEWLAKRLCDYTMENDYDLTCVVWYSSTTKLWATTDTLEHYLDRIHPDYVILCLGANELLVKDLPKREKYVARLVEKIGNRPYFWIGPPNWREDTGINDLILSKVGRGRFFDSRNLVLDRANDNKHPTRVAAAEWMDSVAVWLNSREAASPLRMTRPEEPRHRVYRHYIIKSRH